MFSHFMEQLVTADIDSADISNHVLIGTDKKKNVWNVNDRNDQCEQVKGSCGILSNTDYQTPEGTTKNVG